MCIQKYNDSSVVAFIKGVIDACLQVYRAAEQCNRKRESIKKL